MPLLTCAGCPQPHNLFKNNFPAPLWKSFCLFEPCVSAIGILNGGAAEQELQKLKQLNRSCICVWLFGFETDIAYEKSIHGNFIDKCTG